MARKSQISVEAELTVSGILRSLTVTQLWTIGGAVAGATAALVLLGGWVQSVKDEGKLANKDLFISDLTSEKNKIISDLASEKTKIAAELREATVLVMSADNERAALQDKATFLERFLAYKLAPGDVSQKLFTDYVCVLWKQSGSSRTRVIPSTLQITPGQIRSGLSEDFRAFLIRSGVSAAFLDQASARLPLTQPLASRVAPVSSDAINRVAKQAQSLEVIKIVNFYDGTNYQVPQEIAFAVHNRSECAPPLSSQN
ncbi:hypothetical protein [Mesorhizobium sp.]|uniref:hypothetical protein n=1 Tax=Mesorhizobium sp. TaxID=1871066 RepID=UPI000FE6FDDF|nr:hypothetical protein [Mesorhizobium sp.]RWO49221.1 MAG: hypothetical protein EOS13_23065 [Mesorhizobium sp.]